MKRVQNWSQNHLEEMQLCCHVPRSRLSWMPTSRIILCQSSQYVRNPSPQTLTCKPSSYSNPCSARPLWTVAALALCLCVPGTPHPCVPGSHSESHLHSTLLNKYLVEHRPSELPSPTFRYHTVASRLQVCSF